MPLIHTVEAAALSHLKAARQRRPTHMPNSLEKKADLFTVQKHKTAGRNQRWKEHHNIIHCIPLLH